MTETHLPGIRLYTPAFPQPTNLIISGNVDALLLNVGDEDADTTFRHYASKIATKRAAIAFWNIFPDHSESDDRREMYILAKREAT